jgi:hypothetical protein
MIENASMWQQWRTPYIYLNLLISFIYSIDVAVNRTSVWWRQRFPYACGRVAAQRRRRPASKRWQRRPSWATSMVVEETGGAESGGDLESFEIKSEMTRDELLFIGSNISAAVLN